MEYKQLTAKDFIQAAMKVDLKPTEDDAIQNINRLYPHLMLALFGENKEKIEEIKNTDVFSDDVQNAKREVFRQMKPSECECSSDECECRVFSVVKNELEGGWDVRLSDDMNGRDGFHLNQPMFHHYLANKDKSDDKYPLSIIVVCEQLSGISRKTLFNMSIRDFNQLATPLAEIRYNLIDLS